MNVATTEPFLRGRHRVAAFLYAVTAMVSLVLGAIYLLRDSFMPYHAAALSQGWGELDVATQTLLKALMEVAAGGWLALGALILLLVAVPIRRGERWARFAAPAALLLFYVPTLLATLSVLHQTPASPPWRLNVVACLCAVVGLVLAPCAPGFGSPWRRAVMRPCPGQRMGRIRSVCEARRALPATATSSSSFWASQRRYSCHHAYPRWTIPRQSWGRW